MNPNASKSLPVDIPAILSRYPFGNVLDWHTLGGTSNTTYKVVTAQREIALRVYNLAHSPLQHILLELSVLEHLASGNFACPRPLAGSDGKILQPWNGRLVCATAFLPGVSADRVELTPALVRNVGRLVADLQNALARYELPAISPSPNDSFLERNRTAAKLLDAAQSTLTVDVRPILKQWQNSIERLASYQAALKPTVIHSDLWPPNVLCVRDHVSGLVDFAECCYGAGFMDFAMALMEFSMYKSAILNEELAAAFFAGFFGQGGALSAPEQSLLVNTMEIACAFWWTWEELEGPVTDEGESYLQRLQLFGTPDSRAGFSSEIDRSITAVRA